LSKRRISEAALKEKISEWLAARGFFYRRFAGSVFMRSGVPDFFVMLPDGRACWIEVKRPGRYPKSVWEGCQKDSPGQFRFITEVCAHGGMGLIVDSLEEVVLALAHYA
jgi:hypothetical protein